MAKRLARRWRRRTMSSANPVVSAWFGVEFQGQVVGAFRECSGLGSENEVVEYKASGPKGEFIIKKVPGRMKWNNITLKRGITDAMDMWQWRKMVEQGKIDDARKNGSIVMYSQDGAEVARELRQRLAEQTHWPQRQR